MMCSTQSCVEHFAKHKLVDRIKLLTKLMFFLSSNLTFSLGRRIIFRLVQIYDIIMIRKVITILSLIKTLLLEPNLAFSLNRSHLILIQVLVANVKPN